jgi:hypothetical protein
MQLNLFDHSRPTAHPLVLNLLTLFEHELITMSSVRIASAKDNNCIIVSSYILVKAFEVMNPINRISQDFLSDHERRVFSCTIALVTHSKIFLRGDEDNRKKTQTGSMRSAAVLSIGKLM